MASVVIAGNTSGTVTLQAPDISGSTVLTLPTTSGTILTTASGQWITSGSNIYYNTGNVGIGTTSPAEKLVVSGNVFIPSNNFYKLGSANYLYSDGSNTVELAAGTSGKLNFVTNGASRAVIDSSGNLGLGVTSPLRPLDILQKTNDTTPAILLRGFTTGGDGVRTTQISAVSSDAGNWANIQMNAQSFIWSFQGSTERMRINGSGNVGIGTSSIENYTNYRTLAVGGAVGGVIDFIASNIGVGGNRAGQIFADSSSNMVFSTGASNALNERMRILSGGRVLVGTADSSDTSGVGVKIYPDFAGGDPSIRLVGNTTDSNKYPLMVRSVSDNSWRFYIDYAGNIYARNTSITNLSDVRLKENIRDLDTGLETVMSLKPRRFDWKKSQGVGQKSTDVAGFIAQEVEAVLPEMVSTGLEEDENGEKYKMLAPGMLIPTLVKAIQEQQTIINEQASTIAAFEARLVALENK